MATRADLPNVPGAANSQTTRVLDKAVATDNAVDVPKHVGLCSCPQAHTGNPHPVTRLGSQTPNTWEATWPQPQRCTQRRHTHSYKQDLLKEKRAKPTKRVYQKNPFLDQDYQDHESALHLNFTLPVTKSQCFIWTND